MGRNLLQTKKEREFGGKSGESYRLKEE